MLLPAEAKESKKYLTKGEAVKMLSTTDFVKKKIGDLLSWTVGYDVSKVQQVRLIPVINYLKAMPRRVPPDGRTIIEIVASVDDPAGLTNIAGVRADLSSIGRLSNTALVDTGLFGDKKSADGIYTLQTNVQQKIGLGAKEVPVAVRNKKGWLALAKTALEVSRNPVIIGASFSPATVRAGEETVVTLVVRVDNPGRLEDIDSVVANLKSLGVEQVLSLNNDGSGGDVKADDDLYTMQLTIPSNVSTGNYKIYIKVTNYIGGKSSRAFYLKVI